MATLQAARPELEADIVALGRSLDRAFPPAVRRARHAAEDIATARLARRPQLRAALFRLVDVAPACRTPDDLGQHLHAFLAEVPDTGPPVRAALGATGALGIRRRAVGRLSAAAVRQLGQRFIAGESAKDAAPLLRALWSRSIAASVDLLGEATLSHHEADRYTARCDEALVQLSRDTRGWPDRPRLEHDSAGQIPRVNLSVKVTALTPMIREAAPELGVADAAERLRALLRRARDLGAHLHVDIESIASREAIMQLVLELLAEEEFRAGPSAGIVLQAYLVDSDEVLEHVLDWARRTERASPLTIRLVKGAYWDHEVVEAAQRGWRPPVFASKVETDRHFERLARRLLDARPLVRVAVASHNLRSIAHAIAYHRRSGAPDGDVELQVLRGLGDDLHHAIAAHGLRVRSYCPVGDLVSGMAYLVRRLLENTANDSFLASRAADVDLDHLLQAP
jgi:proline dehydrogenase